MSIADVKRALETWTSDESLVRWFLSVWPMLEEILEAFSQATQLPIFAFMNGTKLFQSSLDTMPPFCKIMLSNEGTFANCVADGKRRAAGEEPTSTHGGQLCYAGMLNGRKEVDVGHLGTLIILYGARKATSADAQARRQIVVDAIARRDPTLATRLSQADADDSDGMDEIEQNKHELIEAIRNVSEHLFKVTLGFHWLSINMAHELCNMMLTSGLAAKRLNDQLDKLTSSEKTIPDLAAIRSTSESLFSENRLGLYVVRNYLSHVSETRYREAVRGKYASVNLREILMNLVSLYRGVAEQKKVTIRVDPDIDVPRVQGISEELQRALHNVLNNAVKYSYHSLPNQPREIRIWSKVPYDPGFRKSRFALTFENYGLGVLPEELVHVTKPGFRGRQAVAEVPVGSGIGLSEVRKIMTAHGGELKFRSREVHRDEHAEPTYVTQVDLVFPYKPEGR